MAVNTRAYIEKYLKIKDKDANIVPLVLNKPQQKLYDALAQQARAGKPMRAIVLKARQMGFSTVTEAIIFKRTAMGRNIKSGIIAHKDEATNNLYNMTRLFYNELPAQLKPKIKANNGRVLEFNTKDGKGLNSSIKCMTAAGQGVGRSDTFQDLHCSEVAYWANIKETLGGLLQTLPKSNNTLCILESTANGYNEFKTRWDDAVAGRSDFVAVFCAWHEMEEYREEYNGFVLTDEEESIKKAYGLDNEQIAWRRWCIINNCGGDLNKFKQEYPACPEEAFLATGTCVFDKEQIEERLRSVKEPVETGEFLVDDENNLCALNWIHKQSGAIKIYEKPRRGVPYVLGGDTAGEGSDWFAAHVIDNTTGKQVAVLHHKYSEDVFARQVWCLGIYYNTALVAVEANYSSYPIKELERLRYPRQFIRQREDENTHRLQNSYGVRTDQRTRPVMIAGLIKDFSAEPELINDADTLREMLVFVRNEQGRPEAMQGEHDDLVMSAAITHYARNQQSFAVAEYDEYGREQDDAEDAEDEVNGFLSYDGG